jgi:uncharacterized protein YggE
MKKIITVAVLAMAASLTLASSIPEFPFVFATGRAELEMVPDTAKMTFRIKAFHKDSSNAVATVQSRSSEVISFLETQGFGKGSLVSYELSKSVVRETQDYKQLTILGYDVSRRFELTFDDLSKYEVVAKTLFKMDDVSEIETSFDRKDRTEIEAKLLASACADAKRNAEGMASGFGKALGEVHCISKQGFFAVVAAFGVGGESFEQEVIIGHMTGGSEKGDIFFIPSTIKFVNQVSVLFRLEKK